MVVSGRQQPASDQVCDECQMGEKTLHEKRPAGIQLRKIVVALPLRGRIDALNMSRTLYEEKIRIVRSSKIQVNDTQKFAQKSPRPFFRLRTSCVGNDWDVALVTSLHPTASFLAWSEG